MPHTQQISKSVSRALRVSSLGCAALGVAYFVVLGNSGAARVPSRIQPALPPPRIKEARQPTPWITISKERTFVTQPVEEDGYIDYLAALNAIASEGATPDNNAAMLLVQAMDLSAMAAPDRQHFYKMLGVDPPRQREGLFPENSAFLTNQGDRFGDTLASMVPWSPEEFAPRARWLQKHEQALDLAVQATRRSHCYLPLVRPAEAKMFHELLLPGLAEAHVIARALTARALLRVQEGKPAEAREDLLACHRLARLVGNGPCLMHGLVGRTIDVKASLADVALLEPGKLNGAEALAYRAELRKLAPLKSVADELDTGERLLFLGFVTELVQQQQPPLEEMLDQIFYSLAPFGDFDLFTNLMADLFTSMWDDALDAANEDWNRWVAAVRTPIASGRKQAFDHLQAEITPLAKQTAETIGELPLGERGTAMGRCLAGKMLPGFADSAVFEDRVLMRADLVQLGLALAAYRADVGSYPATLDALIPKYSIEVPLDRFTRKPLRYEPRGDGYLMYSVGENTVDNAGRAAEDQPPGDDIVVEIPRKIPIKKSTLQAAQRTREALPGAAVLLTFTALGGLTTTLIRLRGLRRLSKWIALAHGISAAPGLVLLIVTAVTGTVPLLGLVSLGLLLVAAGGGAWLFAAFHVRQKRIPLWLLLGHSAIALGGVGLLWFAAYRFDVSFEGQPTIAAWEISIVMDG